MRKGFALMISVFLIFSCTVSVCAAEAQYSTAGDLYEAWCSNLPDYFCGVWSTDGGTTNLTFGIQNNASGNAGKQKILELIENDSSVTFVYQGFAGFSFSNSPFYRSIITAYTPFIFPLVSK